jgi:hypothetical protein
MCASDVALVADYSDCSKTWKCSQACSIEQFALIKHTGQDLKRISKCEDIQMPLPDDVLGRQIRL